MAKSYACQLSIKGQSRRAHWVMIDARHLHAERILEQYIMLYSSPEECLPSVSNHRSKSEFETLRHSANSPNFSRTIQHGKGRNHWRIRPYVLLLLTIDSLMRDVKC